jgi:hypothetical protein
MDRKFSRAGIDKRYRLAKSKERIMQRRNCNYIIIPDKRDHTKTLDLEAKRSTLGKDRMNQIN